MSQGNTRVSGATHGRGDAGNDLVGDARVGKGFHLFAATAEDERVAAFEAKHALSFSRKANHRLMNLLLGPSAFAATLADIDALGVAPNQRENFLRDETVVQNHVALLHEPERSHREQLRIAGSRAYDVDLALYGSRVCASTIEHSCHQSMGIGFATGEQMFGDRSASDAFPKPAPLRGPRDVLVNL